MRPWGLPTEAEVNGRVYEIDPDFRTILEIFVMMDDPDLSDADKTEALLRMFFRQTIVPPTARLLRFHCTECRPDRSGTSACRCIRTKPV